MLRIGLLEPPAGIEQHGRIFAIADPQLLGARQTGQGDLARRCLPGARMRLFPAELPPSRLPDRAAARHYGRCRKKRQNLHRDWAALRAPPCGAPAAANSRAACSDRRQQRRGDAAVLGRQHIVGAAGRPGIHRLDRDPAGFQGAAQLRADRRDAPPEAEQQQLDAAMRENRRQPFRRKRRLRPGLGPVGKHQHRTRDRPRR